MAAMEADRVYVWRRDEIKAMRDSDDRGFTPGQVVALADSNCDLHQARALLASGCPILTAYEILS